MAKNSKSDDSEMNDYQALNRFLLDIDCLDELSQWTSKLNLFDVLKITRTEIRHSNVLAWLLNPNENHGLADSVLRGFIKYYVTAFLDDNELDALLMDYHSFIVQREWNNIDILLVSPTEKCVLCIENKLGSHEHDDQLNRYKGIVEENYRGYRNLYIYLSPEREQSSDPDNWCAMGYEDVINVIETARVRTKLLPEVALLIDNYLDTIRREIVSDERLKEICLEIYSKHQKALDLIYENRPDRTAQLSDILRRWAIKMTEENKIVFSPEATIKTSIRFTTDTMSKIMPAAETAISEFNTHNYYFYEIVNDKGANFRILLSISSKNIPQDLREISDKINKLYPKRNKSDWQWRTPFSTKRKQVDEDFSEEIIFEELDKQFEKVLEFERDLVKGLESLEK